MILVIDSGAYKSDWMLALPETEPFYFRSRGINPFFSSEKEIVAVLQNIQEISPYTDQISEIYFFGSGCTNPDRRELVSNALTRFFPHAFVSIETDLMGSAFATCGCSKGYVAILGTGSNITFFDGMTVQPSRHGVGFILGDEGSGAWFGKKLLTSFLYESMPPHLRCSFAEDYPISKETVIKNVYQRPNPNTYLASFAPFLSKHRSDPYIHRLIESGLDEFVRCNILTLTEHASHSCHFVGSIAYYFQDELRNVCRRHNVQAGKIIQQPIQELFGFIIERELKYEV